MRTRIRIRTIKNADPKTLQQASPEEQLEVEGWQLDCCYFAASLSEIYNHCKLCGCQSEHTQHNILYLSSLSNTYVTISLFFFN